MAPTSPLDTFKTRTKIRPELLEAYEFSARFYGDRDIKAAASQAKRTATILRKSISPLKGLPATDHQQLADAAAVMERHAEELAAMAVWARAYAAHAKSLRERETIDALEALAAKRWAGDAAARAFEIDVMDRLLRDNGLFGDWMHSQGRFCNLDRRCFLLSVFESTEASDLPKHLRPVNKLAEVLSAAGGEHNGNSYWISARDYEAYLAAARAKADTA